MSSRVGVVVAGIIATLLLCCGCAPVALRHTTIESGDTLTDLHYEMVLSNLAMFRQHHGALPWHLKVTQGSAQVSDSATPSFSYGWPAVSRSLGISGTRTWDVSWTVVPTIDHDQLLTLQRLYQKSVDDPHFNDLYGEGAVPGG